MGDHEMDGEKVVDEEHQKKKKKKKKEEDCFLFVAFRASIIAESIFC